MAKRDDTLMQRWSVAVTAAAALFEARWTWRGLCRIDATLAERLREQRGLFDAARAPGPDAGRGVAWMLAASADKVDFAMKVKQRWQRATVVTQIFSAPVIRGVVLAYDAEARQVAMERAERVARSYSVFPGGGPF